jgi:hypothetical protein
MTRAVVLVNRAPVLTLWASIVAERLGFDRGTALSLGKSLAGLNAQARGRRLGVFEPAKQAEQGPPHEKRAHEDIRVELLGRTIPARRTEDGIRAVNNDKPIDPLSVEKYLDQKFGSAFEDVQHAMRALALAFEPKDLNKLAFGLYERFRPMIPEGIRGWGVKGELDLKRIRELAPKTRP